MDSNASRTSVSAVTSSQIASGLVPSTPTRIASYTNGRVRSGSTSSENGNSGTQVALSSRRSSKARPVSIIDDALFNSAASPTSLFDKRRSTQSLVAIAGDGSMIPRPVSPTARGNANGSVSFRAAGESIAEEVDGDWSMRDESQDYSFAGKDSPTRTRSRMSLRSSLYSHSTAGLTCLFAFYQGIPISSVGKSRPSPLLLKDWCLTK